MNELALQRITKKLTCDALSVSLKRSEYNSRRNSVFLSDLSNKRIFQYRLVARCEGRVGGQSNTLTPAEIYNCSLVVPTIKITLDLDFGSDIPHTHGVRSGLLQVRLWTLLTVLPSKG